MRRHLVIASTALVAFALVGIGVVVSSDDRNGSQRPDPAPVCRKLAVPSYFLPGALWDTALAASPTVRYLILNPASGPGTVPDAAYASTVRQAQAKSVSVLGYVDTAYGRRASALVEDEIDLYRDWYGVDGIFLDQVSGAVRDLSYYRAIASRVRQQAGAVLSLNSGTYPDQSYAKLADVLVTFEGNDGEYQRLQIPQWAANYPGERFWHLIYATPPQNLAAVLGLARARGVGNVYVTDGELENPWDRLPSYWPLETEAVAGSTPESCEPGRPDRAGT